MLFAPFTFGIDPLLAIDRFKLWSGDLHLPLGEYNESASENSLATTERCVDFLHYHTERFDRNKKRGERVNTWVTHLRGLQALPVKYLRSLRC